MEEQQSPFKAAIQPGLTIGLVSLALTFIAYFIDATLLGSAWFGLIAIVIFFVLIIYFGKQYRTEIGGYMTFGTAFNFSFIAILISGIISLIGQLLLFHVIDPSLAGVLSDQAFENALSMMENFGASADSMSPEQLEDMRANTSRQFTLSGQLMGFGIGIIIYAIIALILAAILKKRDKSLDY
ncbi:DUF4199 domain-containing protein [Algoriphagus pacificus]|uniref:DUF4199 domain-containing protein n=1 Tax=Algoriphagus pacificus TaxID=2811234 RepID=A0ABS3CLD1_9BACT|nr:DUF4199 domain-containing protein [Algoriphagus pacificus]MBN7817909.1 DUF4199 domain-containing protein [Algoriphagus pacificus]